MTLDTIEGLTLTDEQRAIVEHPMEPLRIVAGAGTGKTTTVVARIAARVASGTAPEAVLGVTFTNKASEELAERLRSALPALAEAGREVEVTTYHGFAWRLLQEFGAMVGVERGAAVIGAGYTRQLLHESLPTQEYTALDLTAPSRRVDEAAQLARGLSDHLANVDELKALAPTEQDDVWEQRIELAGIVARYEKAKRGLGVLDYGDLIRRAHDLVAGHPEMRSRIRARYDLLVLDEYQDTDPGQRLLLQTLFGDGFPVTAVGDEDQTIYEWRGASTANFRAFPTDFRRSDGTPAATLHLTLNRRSGRTVLAVANAIRGELEADAALDPLRAVAGADPGTVELRTLRTADEEAHWIATEVRRLHDEDGMPWTEIAVLFRKHRQIALIRDALHTEGVPVDVVSLGGLLDVPLVADLHAWLRVLGHPGDSAALVRILLSGKYRLGFGDLAPLVDHVRTDRRTTEDEDALPGRLLVEAIENLDQVAGLSDAARVRLGEFATVYREMLVDAQAATLTDLCRRILERTDTWVEVDALEDAPRLSARLNLYRFLSMAEEWSPLRGKPSLDAFLGYLDILGEGASSDELDTARVSSGDAVALLTVHRAKGLEWEAVFLPALAHSVFPASSQGFDNPLVRPSSLPYELRLDAGNLPPLSGVATRDREALRAIHDAQEWRTAYVAVTRSKRYLAMTTAWWYTPRRSRAPSALYDLARTVIGTTETAHAGVPGPPPQRLAVVSAPPPDPLFPDGWQAAMRATLNDPTWPERHEAVDHDAYHAAMDQIELVLDGLPVAPDSTIRPRSTDASVTGLVTLAQCPRRFEWTEIDPLPRRRSGAQRRGIELHRRIELHNRGQVPFETLGDDLYDTPEPGGSDAVASGYDTYLASRYGRMRPRWTETPIDIRVGQGRIRGRIDAVYEDDDGSWEIVDFKSGRRSEDPARRVQLQAYAVAAADGALDPTPPARIDVSFVYLGGGSVGVETERVDDAWLKTARNDLDALLGTVDQEHYEPTPGPGCRTCDFVNFCDEGTSYQAAAETI